MSQIGAPGGQQALPECLVCNWREEKREQPSLLKGPSGHRAEHIPHRSRELATSPGRVWRDCPSHLPLSTNTAA